MIWLRERLNSDGFTLIEVIVALVIISFLLTPLATGYGLYHRATVRADGETMAVFLAQDKMEELKGRAYSALVNGSESDTPRSGYTRNAQVSTGSLGTKTILVTVHYPMQDGTGLITLQTERARR
ncbi:MAG: type II secretion system protein [Eubacteriales bacterium]|nr:type II secretion system GspH family protein [Bacillota bacterium]MBV1726650.1 type II secretion system GspH family protein [Desulforudis sp.]MDP3050042.1 type II secretion system protein [Eubacteriales bacterium]MBV1735139.1 type II secretion system GspH family protein [Desulforudis sp.]MBV1770764.1 type II secretion system GspH family protein [Desulforudis sp.]